MAAGCAAIASRTDGLREVVTHGEDGLFVEAGDEQGLADSIAMLVDEEGTRRRLVSGALRSVERFALDRHIDDVVVVYQSLVQGDDRGKT